MDKSDPARRQQRLAQRLRENLKRRKEQARELASRDKAALPKDEPSS